MMLRDRVDVVLKAAPATVVRAGVPAHFGYAGRARFYHTLPRAARYVKIFTPNPTLLADGATWRANAGGAEVVFYIEPHMREDFKTAFSQMMAGFGVEGGVDYVEA